MELIKGLVATILVAAHFPYASAALAGGTIIAWEGTDLWIEAGAAGGETAALVYWLNADVTSPTDLTTVTGTCYDVSSTADDWGSATMTAAAADISGLSTNNAIDETDGKGVDFTWTGATGNGSTKALLHITGLALSGTFDGDATHTDSSDENTLYIGDNETAVTWGGDDDSAGAKFCDVKEATVHTATDEYRVEFKVNCTDAISDSGDTVTVKILADAAAATVPSTWKVYQSATAAEAGALTGSAITDGTVVVGRKAANKFYHELPFTPNAAVNAGTDFFVQYVFDSSATDFDFALASNTKIFATATLNSVAHISKSPYSYTAPAAASTNGDSASRFVSIASIPFIALLIATFQ